jgi:hypothetical protein
MVDAMFVLTGPWKDFAKTVLSPTAWAYYRSAGDDENSSV